MATASQPTYVEQVQSNIPAWMQKYASQLLGGVFGEQDPETGQFVPGLIGMGYQPYMVPKRDAQGNILKDEAGKPIMEAGQRFAEFTPMQRQAFNRMAGMQTAKQTGEASDLARAVGADATRLGQYTPTTERQFYTDPTFERMQTGFERVSAEPSKSFQMAGPERVGIGALQQYQMGPAERVSADQFGLGATSQYMSPYMQEVVDRQKQAAVRDYARQLPGLKAAGVRAGASGGTREAILESEARRNLATQLGDIQAQGSQSAFQQAQAQYNADRARMLQAGLANQQAGLTTGQQNLAALLGVQQLGTQSGLQAALANQAAQQQAGQTNLQALINQQQFGAGQGLQAQQLNQAAQLQAQQQALAQLAQANQFNQQNAQQRAQYGLAGANLAEQSRQFGAGLGLQGLQQKLAAAGMLGNLGQQQFGQEMGITQGQLGMGGQQQAFNQQMLNQQYQDFINQQQFPYKQAEFAMGILRGIPATGQTSTMYQQAPSIFNQIAGAGMMGIGGLFGGIGQTT
jgi:hypothetical protein